jgi:hypothetical protein
MNVRVLIISVALTAGLVLLGCGKDDKGKDKPKGGDKAGEVEKKEPKAGGDMPTKEDVAKIDCEKACSQQSECYKRPDMAVKVDIEQAKQTCMTGCDALKMAYDPKMTGHVAKKMLDYMAGKCE